MNYESPTLELMGKMEELTGSWGFLWPTGDTHNRCPFPGPFDDQCFTL